MHNLLLRLKNILQRRGFWVILILLVFITILLYRESEVPPGFIANILSELGLTRHSVERILFLVPVSLAGLYFGWKGSCFTSFVVVALMIPQGLYLSPHKVDTFLEITSVFVAGNILSGIFNTLQREKKMRIRLENINTMLKQSEERFRRLFENANDAIIVCSTQGAVLTANRMFSKLTGYEEENLADLNITNFLQPDSIRSVENIKQSLVTGKCQKSTIEAVLIKTDKTRLFIDLSISLNIDETSTSNFLWTIRDISEQKQLQENTRYYLQQATLAQEEERKRIALVLHDEAIQSLIVLSRQLENLGLKDKGLSAENNQLLHDIRQETREIIQSLRQISQNLRPAVLDRLGLVPSLGYLASEAEKHSGTAIKVSCSGPERRLRGEIELMLYRITQEALANIVRHAQAKKAEINVEFNERKIRVRVWDNGKGFDIRENPRDLNQFGKMGLVGMQERAKMINGSITIKSASGEGTCITVEAPL